MKNLLILPHLGLGDAIIINGLVRTIYPRYASVSLVTKTPNYDSVSPMFEDLDCLGIIPVENDAHARSVADVYGADGRYDVLRLGGFRYGDFLSSHSNNHFDEEFYRQAKIPFGYRWSAFKIPTPLDYRLCDTSREYSLVCGDCSTGSGLIEESRMRPSIDRVRPFKTESILYWVPAIVGASEIHCIDSAFLNLVESLDLGSKPLFFHKYARRHPDERLYPTLRRTWTILE